MAIEFCPLEADWGNIADWAAVVVGVFAAAGTIWVASIANSTSRGAAKTAKDAKDIAAQQHNEAVALREGTARILGSLLAAEVLVLPTKLGAVLRSLDKVIPSGPADPHNRATTEWILGELGRTFLPSTEESLDRLHNLPDSLGDRVAQVVGMCRGLVDASQRVDSRFYRSNFQGHMIIMSYNGDNEDFAALRDQLAATLAESLTLARRFGEFAGAGEHDYPDEEGLLKKS
ncbi:hypothetical protein [Stenotrophomonas maltophilia group sp. vghtpe118]|uniref:hypothetical protein n=1 Tax=Stenotrophomonas maltophilia group sp. vghtpe118 TaxID=3459469 RepID=UPI0040415241